MVLNEIVFKEFMYPRITRLKLNRLLSPPPTNTERSDSQPEIKVQKQIFYDWRPASPYPGKNEWSNYIKSRAPLNFPPEHIATLRSLHQSNNQYLVCAFELYLADHDEPELIDTLKRIINQSVESALASMPSQPPKLQSQALSFKANIKNISIAKLPPASEELQGKLSSRELRLLPEAQEVLSVEDPTNSQLEPFMLYSVDTLSKQLGTEEPQSHRDGPFPSAGRPNEETPLFLMGSFQGNIFLNSSGKQSEVINQFKIYSKASSSKGDNLSHDLNFPQIPKVSLPSRASPKNATAFESYNAEIQRFDPIPLKSSTPIFRKGSVNSLERTDGLFQSGVSGLFGTDEKQPGDKPPLRDPMALSMPIPYRFPSKTVEDMKDHTLLESPPSRPKLTVPPPHGQLEDGNLLALAEHSHIASPSPSPVEQNIASKTAVSLVGAESQGADKFAGLVGRFVLQQDGASLPLSMLCQELLQGGATEFKVDSVHTELQKRPSRVLQEEGLQGAQPLHTSFPGGRDHRERG